MPRRGSSRCLRRGRPELEHERDTGQPSCRHRCGSRPARRGAQRKFHRRARRRPVPCGAGNAFYAVNSGGRRKGLRRGQGPCCGTGPVRAALKRFSDQPSLTSLMVERTADPQRLPWFLPRRRVPGKMLLSGEPPSCRRIFRPRAFRRSVLKLCGMICSSPRASAIAQLTPSTSDMRLPL